MDPGTGEILASELTTAEEGDAALVGPLLDQIPGLLASVIADGAYDGEPVYRAVSERQPDPPAAVIIPPRANAVASPTAGTTPSQRDQHLRMIQGKGRLGWQKAVCTAPGTLDNRLPYAARLKACPNQAARAASGLRWPFFSMSHSAL